MPLSLSNQRVVSNLYQAKTNLQTCSAVWTSQFDADIQDRYLLPFNFHQEAFQVGFANQVHSVAAFEDSKKHKVFLRRRGNRESCFSSIFTTFEFSETPMREAGLKQEIQSRKRKHQILPYHFTISMRNYRYKMQA